MTRRQLYKSPGFWFSLTLTIATAAGTLCASKALSNPLFEGADPGILVVDKEFWIYPTESGTTPEDALFTFSSADLKNWTSHGPILRLKDIAWIESDGSKWHQLWAPGVIAQQGKYYLYFSVGPQNPTPSRIGVAVSDTPAGPFTDSGRALITGGNGFEAIDAMAFSDPQSNKTYLYCGGSAGSKLHVYELNADLTSIKKEVSVPTPQNYTEGPFMHFYHGTYYLSYSHGKWNDDSYCICYATAKTPIGPWDYHGKILQTDDKHAGPGHHSFFINPADGKLYIAYHRWNGAKTAGKMPPSRSVAIERVDYDKEGNILPVKMTDQALAK